MPYRITYEYRSGYLYVLMEGQESFDAAVQFWERLAKKSEEEHIRYFLITDKVSGGLDTLQIFDVSELVAKLFHGKVIAYVDPKEKTFKDNQFGETVVRNRGGDAKVFHSEMEADQWLMARMHPQ